MVRRLLLSAACVGTAFAHEPPNLEREGDEFVLVGEEEPTRFVASGGATDPPSIPGTGPWILTGRRQYIWGIEVTEPVEGGLENPHPLDGTVSESDTLEISNDKPGSYSVSVSLQEEWQDTSHPQSFIFWPLADGELPPDLSSTGGASYPTSNENPPAPRATPPLRMPAFPIVPPFATAEERR